MAVAATAYLGTAIGIPDPLATGAINNPPAAAPLPTVPRPVDRGVHVHPPGARPAFPVAGSWSLGTSDNAFGASRPGHIHAGQDILASAGTPLVATRDAVVSAVGSDGGGYGNYIVIYASRQNRSFLYAHLISPSPLRLGQSVRTGQTVGNVGCTGSCSGDHVHFEIRLGYSSSSGGSSQINPVTNLLLWARPDSERFGWKRNGKSPKKPAQVMPARVSGSWGASVVLVTPTVVTPELPEPPFEISPPVVPGTGRPARRPGH